MATYCAKLDEKISALKQTFKGMSHHDRLAVIGPDQRFVEMLREHMRSDAFQARHKCTPVTAARAAQTINTAAHKHEKWIVVDTVDNFDGGYVYHIFLVIY